jgi:transcription elongation factor Elf1
VSESRADVKWSPRVPKWKLRRLYERVAQGIWDDELIDDVGMTLFMRCRDILRIHRASAKKLVTCPRCDRTGTETLIHRKGNRDTPIVCPVCGWSMTWYAYHRTWKRRQLNPGGAVDYFRAFVDSYPRAGTPRDKMLAIDLVIHSWHFSLRDEPDRPTRPAGVNLVVGKLGDVVRFMDELSGLTLPSEMQQTDRIWRERYASTYWADLPDAVVSGADTGHETCS